MYYCSKFVFVPFLIFLALFALFILFAFLAFFGVAIPLKYLLLPFGLLVLTFILRNHPWLLLLLLFFDLGRFSGKFLPFAEEKYFYPQTAVIKFLQEQTKDGAWRFMTLNDEIFPPNSNMVYKLQTVNGYDPLYLKSYAALVGGGNRIIVPKDYKNPVFNQLGVKYILSFEDLPDYRLVFQEGKTKVYENPAVLPRVFFAGRANQPETARIVAYLPDKVVVETANEAEGILILSDMDYPGWRVYLDGVLSKIVPTPYNFRSVSVPVGRHRVVFQYEPDLFGGYP